MRDGSSRLLAAVVLVVGQVATGCSATEVATTTDTVLSTTTETVLSTTTEIQEPPATFEAFVVEVDAEALGSSWREGCPVREADLRLLAIHHWDFEGEVRRGELVVHRDVAEDLVTVFASLFDAGFPMERVEPVQVYGSDDDVSMAANNTSAFNCRRVAGTTSWSEHAFGTAIDINPVQNPYLRSGVLPPSGAEYLDRSDVRPGMIVAGDVVVRAFSDIGWKWGGEWSSPDYQHFSESGR